MFGSSHHRKDDALANEGTVVSPNDGPQPVSTDAAEDATVVYGFYDDDRNLSRRDRRSKLLKGVYTTAVVVAALAGILMLSRFAMSSMIKPQGKSDAEQAQSDNDDETKETTDAKAGDEGGEEYEDEEPVVWQVANVPAVADIKELVTKHLVFNDEDYSASQGKINVEILGGFVQITQSVNSSAIEPLGAKTCVSRAAIRAAATSKALAAHAIRDEDGGMTPFGEVLWIVCDETGDSYISVNYNVEATPDSGDGIEVLKQASHYRMSDTLYADLKLPDVPQQTQSLPSGSTAPTSTPPLTGDARRHDRMAACLRYG